MKLFVASAEKEFPYEHELKQRLATALRPALVVSGTRELVKFGHDAFDAKRRQWNGEKLLASIADFARNESKEFPAPSLLLVLFPHDFYAPRTAHALGMAEQNGRVALVNTFRLNPALDGRPDDAKWLERAFKESLHEVGHCLGLDHCTRVRCAMHDAPRPSYVDRKEPRYCAECRRKAF